MKQWYVCVLSVLLFYFYTYTFEYKIVTPVSVGELLDKLTILAIKTERFTDEAKKSHAVDEFNILKQTLLYSHIITQSTASQIEELTKQLIEINQKLWSIEDKIRIKELHKQFDEEFIMLARLVYFTNDERAHIKRKLNIITGSPLIEEKQYTEYT